MFRKIAETKIEYRRLTGEYLVKAYDETGKRIADADYFTCDRDDAKATAEAMERPYRQERGLV